VRPDFIETLFLCNDFAGHCDRMKAAPPTTTVTFDRFTVLNIVLESGERLPCLVDAATWLPARVAMRWAVRFRRYRVQASTLASNLHILAQLYQWTREHAGFDLDTRLTQGHVLQNRELESFLGTLRTRSDGQTADAGTFDRQLAVVENFLTWSLQSDNRGGGGSLSVIQLAAERTRIEELLRSLRVGARPSSRIQPIEDAEIDAIRKAIGPLPDQSAGLSFPPLFASHTRLRNWLMFETALELGVRRGELLKLRLDSLPRGADDGIRILRRPDDPLDSRPKEPAVKTAERAIPASRELLRAIQAYLTYPRPLGRVPGKSPYLFVARSGNPLSIDTADDIISLIGRFSGVSPLSWHRLRHTWAERMAQLFADQPNGIDRLMYLGGWTNPLSTRRYVQRTLERQAKESLRAYHEKLYKTERD
jgi:integrase